MPKLGPKAYEQCAGFLRIREGEQPLDATGVHPESYPAAQELLKKLQLDTEQIREGWKKAQPVKVSEKVKDKKAMAAELGIGEITLTDILKELEKPGRDPREDMPAPILKEDVLEMNFSFK